MKQGSVDAPALNFTLTQAVGGGFPAVRNDAFNLLLDQAVSGGAGTANYLGTMLKFSSFASYLQNAGSGAFAQSDGANGSRRATATDGTTTLNVDLGLIKGEPDSDDPPIFGLATVQLALPDPENVVKITQFAVALAELPPGMVIGPQLWQALFSPLVGRLTSWLQSTIEGWGEIDGGEVAADIGAAVTDTSADVAAEASAEAAEVVVGEEVVAVASIDLAAAFPPLAALGLLVAVPLIISALAKNFVLHVEVDNLTRTDFTWSIPYTSEGALTVQPSATLIPAMNVVKDSWGDSTTVQVAFQADFAAMNKSGFSGIGFLLLLTPAGRPDDNICALISIPWLSDNVIWMGSPGAGTPDWSGIYDAHSDGESGLTTSFGTRAFSSSLSIDALSGNQDAYHCVLRIEDL